MPCSTYFAAAATLSTEIYTLSLHDALPISGREPEEAAGGRALAVGVAVPVPVAGGAAPPEEILASTFCTAFCRSTRSEEHTSELQSHSDLVCRLLLEKKNAQRESTPTQANP